MSKLSNKEINGYKLIKLIGKGAFGYIYQGNILKTKEVVAIKVVEIERFKECDGLLGKLVLSEQDALKKVKSQYVVGFIDCFQDNSYNYLVMEYCDSGDLEQQIKDPKTFLTEQDAIGILRQILQGLRDMHAALIIHRDLKLANILIHNHSIYKIADLGFSKILQNETDLSCLQLGSLYTMAPEIYNQNSYGLSSDMFSVGVIFYQILFGRFPFSQNDYELETQPLINFTRNKIPVSEASKDLITKMLQFDPQKRIKFEEIAKHKVFEKQMFNQISRIQLQSSKVRIEEHSQFYQKEGKKIEKENQQEIQATKERLMSFKKPQEAGQNLQQQQLQSISNQIIDINLISGEISLPVNSQKKNEMNQKINHFNKTMNDIYYFSNTIQEVFQIQMRAHYAAIILCYQVKIMTSKIQEQMQDQIQIHKGDIDLEFDLTQLKQILELAEQLYMVIDFQLQDIAQQQIQSGDIRIQEMLKNQISKKQLNDNLYNEINALITKENNQITYVLYHMIKCCQYCFMLNQQYKEIELDINNFDIKKSKQIHPNQNDIKLDFKKIQEYDQQIQ
ncbi:unnamed protein product (macronuclear) [Paramecium tetraurelia]|uniref:Protein kinase domain-containing protein n=1 Tax=Paramecium tetraurelia TaxID=5888 RepID=A0E6E1_PARTE|nr:uncharacterized protein GSPATT00003723001 [Paramecium tetraurelia]CAK90858.1 unnamed protein product [Paramecium tetraurelia]|eukprot:XP_001458255.1 hypothetical protein (macronuclear) [Paramecium tetraurelia strain d4-2]